MKTIIEFDNFEEKTELLQALNASAVYSFLYDLAQELRAVQKYGSTKLFGEPFEDIDQLVEIIRLKIPEVTLD